MATGKTNRAAVCQSYAAAGKAHGTSVHPHARGAYYAEKVKALSDRLNQLNREIAETLVEDGKQQAVEATTGEKAEEKPSSNRKYSLDNSDNLGYNNSKKYSVMTDQQKEELFGQVSGHVDAYIESQVAEGKNRDELLRELGAEHSAHREKLLGGYRATARDFEARKGDKEHRQRLVEKHWPAAKEWVENREARIKEAYDLFTAQIKEAVDYAGVLYREVIIDRARAQRNPGGGIQLHSWRDAERQRSKGEAGNHQNSIRPTSRSDESGFSNAKHFSIDGKPIVGVRKYSIDAWHGSGATGIDRLQLKYVGTGEGAQAHGYGLYFAKGRDVSEGYRERLAGKAPVVTADDLKVGNKTYSEVLEDVIEDGNYNKQVALEEFEAGHFRNKDHTIEILKEEYEATDEEIAWFKKVADEVEKQLPKQPGSLFQVEIPDEDVMLDENKPFSEQPKKVQEALKKYAADMRGERLDGFISDIEKEYGKDTAKTVRQYIEDTSDNKKDYTGWNPIDILLDSANTQSPYQKLRALPDSESLIRRASRVKRRIGRTERDKANLLWYFEHANSGGAIYRRLTEFHGGNARSASEALNDYGIKGITYMGGRDGRCYVVFDDKAIEIIQRLAVGEGKVNKRSMAELKAEIKEAFPYAKIVEEGNTLKLTMPNGQKVTVTLHESIEVSDDELALAKSSHGIGQNVSVTIEGYAETVGLDGFIALSQGSREGTGFHEAYHIAEAIAFTKKELADANRLISENEEERANAYAKWKMDRKQYSNFAKLWQKIADVAAKMAGLLGYETKRNLFRKVESGEVYERDNKSGKDLARKYSVNPSDNSSESLAHRIKNLLSGQKPEEYRHRKMMADLLGKALKITIRGGKIADRKGNVIYKENDRVLRSKHMYDWENILPVAGGIIAEQLGIVKEAKQTSEAMKNYIADWILTGAPNNTSKEAKEFQKGMQRNPHLADKLQDVRNEFEKWNSMGAKEQMRASIQMTKQTKTNWRDVRNYLYDQLYEELGPIERMVEEIQGEMKKKGHKLSYSVNPMIAFRLARGAHGRAITMIEGRGEAAVNALKKNFPNVDFTGFKTLHDIIKSIGAFQNIEKQRDFITYCTACHVLDMHKHNKDMERYIDALDLKKEKLGEENNKLANERAGLLKKMSLYQDEVKRLSEIEATIDANNKEMEKIDKEIEMWKKDIMVTPDAFSEENCRKYIADGKKKYDQAQKDLVHFSNTTAAILYDSGVISEKRYNDLLKTWPNYVPMFRVFEDNEDIDFGDSMKHIKGSMRDIVNPLESIIRNTTEFVKKSETNKARCLLANLARCDGSGMLLEEVDNAKPNDKTTITFYEDGKKKYLQTDPEVVKAVNNMDRDSSNAVLHLLHKITSVARTFFTIASPEFATRNIFRDYADAFVYNKNGFIGPSDMIRAFIHAVNRDETYYEWLSSGAAMASAVSIDRNYTQETINKLGRSLPRRLASRNFFSACLEVLQKASEYSEYATRIAMYEKNKEHISKQDAKAVAYEAIVGAAFESRDLMDFARHGKAGAFWNKLVPFANASLQGMNKFYRTVLDPKGWRERPKEMAWAFARLALSSILPAMLLCMLHRDDDWYKEAPDWLKETHWLIPVGDTIIRIPKGSDVGIRFFANMVEKGMSDKSHKPKEYGMPLWDALPDLLPIAVKPIIEAYMNKSFFTGRNIVPQYQEKLPEKLQYGPYTTGMSKVIGEQLGVAPSKVDHLISGYTGSIGMLPLKTLDILAGDRQLDTSLEELPLTRAITYMPYKNPQSVQDFYKKFDEQTRFENEYKLTGKKPEGYNPSLLADLKDVKKKLSKLSKKEKQVIDNPKYNLEQRKSIQMKIQHERIKIVSRVIK